MGVSIRSSVIRAVVIAWLSVGFAHSAVVRGVVRGADGEAVSEAVVSLVPADDEGVNFSASSNRAGAFLFGTVRPGRYAVRAEAPGLVLALVEGSARAGGGSGAAWQVSEAPLPDSPIVISISEGQDVELLLRVEKGLSLGGRTLTAGQALDTALASIQAGNCARAEEELSALLAVDPEIPKAHYLRGFCRGSSGDVDAAIEALDRTLALKPGYPGASLLKAQILAGAKRVPEAESAFRAEIGAAGRPQLVRDAWWGLGLLLRDAGRLKDALVAFEHRRVAARQALTADSLSTLYLRLLRKYHGHAQGIMRIDPLYGIEWAYIPHFYYHFYVYQYVSGFIAATAFAERVLDQGAPAARQYKDAMLRAGASADPLEILRRAGVDMMSPRPYRLAIRRFTSRVRELAALGAPAGGRP